MEKEFVPYELAVKLKALGFDEPCFGWFTDSQHLYIDNIRNGKMFKSDNGCLAPTFSQAFRWFREKHNLSGTSQYFTGEFYCYTVNDMKDTKESNRLFTEFETFEEAELACLDKLIEIVEGIEY
jgi:hypothetical protein